MQDLKTFLTQEKPGTLMGHYSLPCIISLLVAALYNIVDQIFIANASYLGSYGNSANTVVYPLTVAALSVAVLIGDGVCAFSSIASGAGRTDDTHHAVGNGIVMCIVSSLVITALYLVFADQIITLFGAANEAEIYTEFAIKSFRVYLMLMPLATVNKGTFISMQALGKAKESTLLSLFREIVLGCGLATLLPVFFGLDGVLYSMPASDFFAFLVAAHLILTTLRELNSDEVTDLAQAK